MRKWTVRIDDDTAACFTDWCDKNGVSMSATIAAMIDNVCVRHEQHGRQPVTDWPTDVPYLEAWQRLAGASREVDAMRRRKRPAT